MRCRPSCRDLPRGRRALDAPNLETECSLLYTSGTTGRPKGCLLSNFYTLNAGETYRDHGGLMEIRRGQERFYNPLPLFHINHLNIMSTAAMQTANTLILPSGSRRRAGGTRFPPMAPPSSITSASSRRCC